MTNYTNVELIKMLNGSNDVDFNKSIYYLKQRMISKVNLLIKKRGGANEDAEEVLNEALFVAHQYAKEAKFKTNTSVEGFIYKVAGNLYYTQNKNKLHMEALPDQIDRFIENEFETNPVNEEQKIKLNKAMKLLCNECRAVLEAFYYQNMSMLQIKEKFNLGSIQAAKNKKYRCMEKLKNAFQMEKQKI